MGYDNMIVTRHLRERIQERFPDVYEEIKRMPTSKIKKLIDEGYVSKSFLNNTKFMEYLYKTYGYEHTYDFVLNGDIVFVIKKKEGEHIAVTCLNKKSTTFIKKATQFKDKKKKMKYYKKPAGVHDIDELDDMEVDIDDLLSKLRK